MSELTRPAGTTAAVTASDSADIAKVNGFYPRALYIGGAGDVAIVSPDGVVSTFKGAAAGSVLPVQTRRVNSTNTTATDIVALY